MPTQAQMVNVGLVCEGCGRDLPIPINPFPFPGLYICPKCQNHLSMTVQEIEVQVVEKDDN